MRHADRPMAHAFRVCIDLYIQSAPPAGIRATRYATFIGGSWHSRRELLNQPPDSIEKTGLDGTVEHYEKFKPTREFAGLPGLRSDSHVTYVLSTMSRQALLHAIQSLGQPLFVEIDSGE